MKGKRGFEKNDPNINMKGRPKDQIKNDIRKIITETLDISLLLSDISSLPIDASVKYRLELLKYILPALKATEILLHTEESFSIPIIKFFNADQ